MKKLLALMPVSAAVIGVTGCSTTTINESKAIAQEDAVSVERQIDQTKKMTRSSTTVEVLDELFVAGTPFRLKDRDNLPDFFDSSVTFKRLNPVSLQDMIGLLQQELNTRIEVTDDAISYIGNISSTDTGSSDDSESRVDRQMDEGTGLVGSEVRFQIDYQGTVSGLLDHLTTKANLYWKWKGNRIVIFRMETKQYLFDGDTSSSTFSATMSSGSSAGESNESSSSSTATSGQKITRSRSIENQVASLDDAIQSMLSSGGKFNISSHQGVVTVTDTPEVQDKVAEYLDNLNSIVNKQIAIKTTIYEIAIQDTGEFGISLNAAYEKIGSFSSSLTQSFADSSSNTLSLSLLNSDSPFAGTKALINALSEVANVSKKTETVNYTKNGRILPLQMANERSYVASTNPVTNDEGSVTGFEATPASVLTGLTLNLTPRINSEGDIDINFAADISQLDSLETINMSIGDGITQMIQLPDKSFKSFMQDVSIESGRSLIVAGFEREENESSVSSLAGEAAWALGGTKSGGKTRVMNLVVLTPYIMAK